jgi:hypothetical protein
VALGPSRTTLSDVATSVLGSRVGTPLGGGDVGDWFGA